MDSKTNQKPLQDLLNADMDRRQFLGFLGAATLAVVGASSIVKGLSSLANRDQPVTNGYGGGAYGGRTRTSR